MLAVTARWALKTLVDRAFSRDFIPGYRVCALRARRRPVQCAAVVAIISLLACFGCNRAKPEPTNQLDELLATFAASSLETVSGVQRAVSNAAASDRAIMFIHVDWAPMEVQRSRYAQFVVAYRQSHPRDNFTFYYIDCTPVSDEYEPLENVAGWRELQDASGAPLIHGHGEVVWMERGRVLHVQQILDFESPSHLVKQTERLMPTTDEALHGRPQL